jgi:hypothetical protein
VALNMGHSKTVLKKTNHRRGVLTKTRKGNLKAGRADEG